MSIRPQATPLAADDGSGGGFNAQAVASRMLAFRNSGQIPTPEQQQAFRDQFSTMTPEQRTEVFQQLRQMGGGMNAAPPPAANAAARPAAATQRGTPSSPAPASTPQRPR
jgi:hypothetical protein